MSQATIDETTECPYLQPARPLGGNGQLIGIYCRFPDGHIRVPPAEDKRRFCLTGRWKRCPVYQHYAATT
jgi:hypothetical protein